MRYFYRIAHFDDGGRSSSFDRISELGKMLDNADNELEKSVLINKNVKNVGFKLLRKISL